MKSVPLNTEFFADYFRDHIDSYVIIGGTATLLRIERQTGTVPRATKDLDVVVLDLSEDEGSSAFLKKFTEYVKANGYSCQSLAGGKSQAYRFSKPTSSIAPRLIEIISKKFTWTPEAQGAQRIDGFEMSAIILAPEFYEITKSHRTTEQIGEFGNTPVPVAKVAALILLKAYAYQNLIGSDQEADRSKAPKHLIDIARLAAVLTNTDALTVSTIVFSPLKSILDQATIHFPTEKLYQCGWAKNTKPGEMVRAIQNTIKVT